MAHIVIDCLFPWQVIEFFYSRLSSCSVYFVASFVDVLVWRVYDLSRYKFCGWGQCNPVY